jgi:hypothetical protein
MYFQRKSVKTLEDYTRSPVQRPRLGNLHVVHVDVGENSRLERHDLLTDRPRCACEGDARESGIDHLQVSDSHVVDGNLMVARRELVVSGYGRGADLLAQLRDGTKNYSRLLEATHCAR